MSGVLESVAGEVKAWGGNEKLGRFSKSKRGNGEVIGRDNKET